VTAERRARPEPVPRKHIRRLKIWKFKIFTHIQMVRSGIQREER
jgi:hypothetical protein